MKQGIHKMTTDKHTRKRTYPVGLVLCSSIRWIVTVCCEASNQHDDNRETYEEADTRAAYLARSRGKGSEALSKSTGDMSSCPSVDIQGVGNVGKKFRCKPSTR